MTPAPTWLPWPPPAGLPKRRVDEVLALVGLEAVAGRRAGTFSLGMGQRLGIAAALLGDPAVLLFDEPTNGLDPEGILWIRNLMRNLAAEGRAVLVSSHLMSEMALTADHLVVIGRGRLIADEPLEAFVARTSTETVLVRTPERDRLAAVLAGLGAYTDDRDGVLEVVGVEARRDRRRRAGRRCGHPRVDARPGVVGGGLHGTDPGQRRIRRPGSPRP